MPGLRQRRAPAIRPRSDATHVTEADEQLPQAIALQRAADAAHARLVPRSPTLERTVTRPHRVDRRRRCSPRLHAALAAAERALVDAGRGSGVCRSTCTVRIAELEQRQETAHATVARAGSRPRMRSGLTIGTPAVVASTELESRARPPFSPTGATVAASAHAHHQQVADVDAWRAAARHLAHATDVVSRAQHRPSIEQLADSDFADVDELRAAIMHRARRSQRPRLSIARTPNDVPSRPSD